MQIYTDVKGRLKEEAVYGESLNGTLNRLLDELAELRKERKRS